MPNGYRFKPGDEWTGNAGGRPKSVTPLLNVILKQRLSKAAEKRMRQRLQKHGVLLPEHPTLADCAAGSLIAKADVGNLRAIQILYDRVDGRPRQKIMVEDHTPGEVSTIRGKLVALFADKHFEALPAAEDVQTVEQ